jgi:hypothetical protein
VLKSCGLEMELAEVKGTLQKESDEHDGLRVVIRLICEDLGVALVQEASSLAVRSLWIIDRAREIARRAVRFGVQ